MATKAAVCGVDIGSDTSFVAYVGKGIVDIVQNEVSKRNTSSLVGFTNRERLLGDVALAQIKSNAKNTCRNFKHLLGQKVDSPNVEKEKFWSTCELEQSPDGNVGYSVTYKGEPRSFTTPQITAMFLSKLKEITENWCQAKLADIVVGVPAYFSDIHRQALLDAAAVANISVLRLMNEHTATALAYGIYRSNDFDPEKPCTVAFCSMGHSVFSVSVVQFVRGKLTVICENSDKVGGRDMDECLMREFAAQFKKKVGCDPLTNKKASFKLEDAVGKTKKILSANNEGGVNCECLMEDEDFASNMKRADFEQMCEPMMDKVKAVLEKAKVAMNMPVEQLDFVEIVGGASRVPWVKRMCSDAFGGMELSTTMNADESVSRGCALQAAMLSPLYKVRDFKVEDFSPFGISVGWLGSSADAEAKEEDSGDAKMTGGEGEYKSADVFPVNSAMNTVKVLTFYRKGPFELTAQYTDPSKLLPGTPAELGKYKIELPASEDVKKVKVRAKLTLHGTFCIEGAQVLEEEEYEETVKEKRELPAEEASPKPEENSPEDVPMAEEEAATEKTAEGEAAAAPAAEKKAEKKPESKFEWVDVKKMKKRTKKTDLAITKSGASGMSAADIQKRMDEESAMQAEMAEIIDTDAKKNDLEGYIFTTRDKLSGVWAPFITDADRDAFSSELMKAEDWLYDQYDGTKAMFVEKLQELKAIGDPVQWRHTEHNTRDEWIEAIVGTITNYRAAAENPGDKYGHIAPEKLGKIVQKCDELKVWLEDMKAKQAGQAKTEKPVLLCADMEKKNQELAKAADDILKEPKPAPPTPEKTEEKPAEAAGENAEEKKEGEGSGEEPKVEGEAASMDVDVD